MEERKEDLQRLSSGTFQTVYTVDVEQLDMMIEIDASPFEIFIDLKQLKRFVHCCSVQVRL